jgi:hypothetical protein
MPVEPWVSVVGSFFKGKMLKPYTVEEWAGSEDRPVEIDRLHQSIEDLARAIEASSISNVEEFEGWVDSVLKVIVSQVEFQQNGQVDRELRRSIVSSRKSTGSANIAGSFCWRTAFMHGNL